MRRQIQLEDYDFDHTFTVSTQGEGGRKVVASNTDEFKMKDISIETMIRNSNKEHTGVQVDQHAMLGEIRGEGVDAGQAGAKVKAQGQEDENQENEESNKRLVKFLRKIVPLVQQQMNQDLPIYQRFGLGSEQSAFKKQSRLANTLQNIDQSPEQKLQISDLSWNATGVIIAAAYSHPQHEGTCNHKSMICLWALFKRNFKPTRPDVIITPSCINCISFHPKKPSILACGSYTGEVLLYDYAKNEQQLLAKTVVDDYFHRDLITKIIWWPYRSPGKADVNHNLLSLGTDGKILLWEVPNQAVGEDANPTRVKNLLKYPIKGFLMLRKKEKEVIPVSGLTMNQSRVEKNYFVVGSEGGSILRATLTPINYSNESKVILDMQPTIKFKKQVYPFLTNIISKNLPQVKAHIEKYCTKMKIKQVQNLKTVLDSMPEIIKMYPNPISFAYEPLAFPISSISDNKYGLFIVNAYQGYSRVYIESSRTNLEYIEEGWEWGWLNGSHLMAGFVGQEWVVVDWTTGATLWSVGVGEGTIWREQGRQVALVCDRTKVKIVELGDKLVAENEEKHREVVRKIEQLKTQ